MNPLDYLFLIERYIDYYDGDEEENKDKKNFTLKKSVESKMSRK